jgi:hypothetical protein
MTPRTDQTALYELRTKTAASPGCPPFFMQAKHIKAAYCITKVWNVYAQSNEADKVAQELKAVYNTQSLRQFFTWKEYQSLHLNQQLTILQLHNTFTCDFRSLLIHGFNADDIGNNVMWDDDIEIYQTQDIDGLPSEQWEFHQNNEETTMTDESIEDRFHNNINLKKINISNFIQQAFLSGDQSPVFAHVYEPVMGTREVLVTTKHIPEALELIKVIKTDCVES